MAQALWIGLDAGETLTRLCALDSLGSVVRETECQTTLPGLQQALKGLPKRSMRSIALESGCASHLARGLKAKGYPVEILEARKAKRLLEIRPNKTDANDARGLADLVRLRATTGLNVHLKSVEFQLLRTRLTLRNKLVEQRVAIDGAIRCLIRLYGGGSILFDYRKPVPPLGEAEVKRLKHAERIDLSVELEPLVAVADGLRAHIKIASRWIEEAAHKNPVCQRFLEIPGVGPITAVSFYSAIENPVRFARTANAAAYLGLAPRIYSLGKKRPSWV